LSTVIAAIVVFPVLTLLLFGLAKAENVLSTASSFSSKNSSAEPVSNNEISID